MSAERPIELGELLRRCHRVELVPLADSLGIKHFQLSLDRLAAAIEGRVRRAGDYDLRNILLRRGRGPGWAQVLQGFATRHQFTADPDPARAEIQVLEWWVERFWTRIDATRRQQIWELMELEMPAPEDAQTALKRVHAQPDYLMTRPGLKMFAISVLPAGGCLFVLWLTRPRDDLLVPAVLEIARLRQSVRHRVTVGVVGSPSSGKDAAIAAIFGIDSGNVNPVAGSTSDVEITQLADATALFVVNTPGMGDVIEGVTERAREVLDLIDVYIYVVNAQGGVQAREKADYERCLASGRPVLAVVNKIDTIKEADRQRYLDDAREKLDAEHFLSAAFDPLPMLSETPIGVEAVQQWLTDRLIESGKDPREFPWS